jgi:hypothetical protein
LLTQQVRHDFAGGFCCFTRGSAAMDVAFVIIDRASMAKRPIALHLNQIAKSQRLIERSRKQIADYREGSR